jgi:hypothetical protein
MSVDRINSLLKNNNRDSLLRLTKKHQARGLSKLNKRQLATIIAEAEAAPVHMEEELPSGVYRADDVQPLDTLYFSICVALLNLKASITRLFTK